MVILFRCSLFIRTKTVAYRWGLINRICLYSTVPLDLFVSSYLIYLLVILNKVIVNANIISVVILMLLMHVGSGHCGPFQQTSYCNFFFFFYKVYNAARLQEDQHNIRQVVVMLCLVSVYLTYLLS